MNLKFLLGLRRVVIPLLLLALLLHYSPADFKGVRAQTELCERPYLPVATPLIDLGSQEYIRMDGQETGFTGGLYPDGSNQRPPDHNAAGLQLAGQVQPLGTDGNPDPDGRIVMISVGMSNAAAEFGRFVQIANEDPRVNPQLVIINGALSNQTAERWSTPENFEIDPWELLDERLTQSNLTPQQVQVAWVKNVLTQGGDFPEKAQELQGHLEIIAQKLIENYPNLKLAYFSSRTRSYTYERGLSPEPVAYETGFAVRWMITRQIEGAAELNFNPANGTVRAPYLSWGPYLWADGPDPRADGFTWLAEDMTADCTHPSSSGINKVANLLLDFFTSDTTAAPWFLAGANPPPPPTEPPTQTVLPLILNGTQTPAVSPTGLPANNLQPRTPESRNPALEISPTPQEGRRPYLRNSTRAVFIGAAVSGIVVIAILSVVLAARRR